MWAQQHPKTALVALTVVIFIFLLLAGLFYRTQIRNSPHFDYFIAVLTGNWNKSEKAEISDAEYIVGVVLAFVINIGAYVAIFGALWGLIRETRRRALTTAKEAIDAFANTAEAVLLREFAPPGSFEKAEAELDDTTRREFQKTADTIERLVDYSRAISMKSLVQTFGREQVEALFGKNQVDSWLQQAAQSPPRTQVAPGNGNNS